MGSSGFRLRRAGLPAAVGAVLVAAAFACGRRGPPLPPVRVTPEEPRLLPLRQEGGEIVIRWVAPARAAGGDDAELRLRRAVVLHRVVDLERRIGEARAARRAEAAPAEAEEEMDPPEGEDAPAEDPAEEAAAAAPPEGVEPALSEEPAARSEPGEPGPAGEEPADPAPGGPGTGPEPAEEAGVGAVPDSAERPDTERPQAARPDGARVEEEDTDPGALPEAGPSTDAGEGAGPGEAEREEGPLAEPGEEQPAEPGEEQPAEPDEEQPAESGGEQPAAPGGEQPAEPGGEQSGEPGGEGGDEAPETGSAEPVEELTEEPEAPTGVVVEYDGEGEELEVLSEVESEIPGEERTLRLPVRPDWVGRRLVVALRYESGSEPSRESERREIDVAAPLPDAGPLTTTVGAAGVALAWPDIRPEAAAAAPLSNPLFEVVRRRGTDSAQAARIPVPRWTDGSVVWGEEVCYSVRLVVVGDDEPRTVEDPGPEFDPPTADSSGTGAEADSAAAPPGAAAETEEPTASEPPGAGSAAAGSGESGEEDREGGEGEGAGERAEAGAGEAGAEEAEAAGPPTAEGRTNRAAPPGTEAEAEGGGALALPEETPGETGTAPSWEPIPVQVPPTGSRTMSTATRSREVCLVPEDTFAPPTPTDVRAFWRPEATELNWRAADAPDVRGYAVYRSEAEGSGYERLTPEPVEAASFSDRGRDPETLYFYTVTALDTAAPPNESPRSAPVPVRPRSR